MIYGPRMLSERGPVSGMLFKNPDRLNELYRKQLCHAIRCQRIALADLTGHSLVGDQC
jgi:hypothetical protein